jgi:integrase/recombinase XerD
MSRGASPDLRKVAREKETEPSEGCDPSVTLQSLALQYFEWMKIHHYSMETITGKRRGLERFFRYCEDRGVRFIDQVSASLLELYQKHLFYYRSERSGKPLSILTQRGELERVRAFFKWLTRRRLLSVNPALVLELPKAPRRLPKKVLSIGEIERVMGEVKLKRRLGFRTRAILEVFYSSGIRRQELVRLKLQDLDLDRGVILIHQGKGHKDRVVPIGERALYWVTQYLEIERPELAGSPDAGFLFLTQRGRPFHPNQLTALVRQAIQRSQVEKSGSCHLLRHTVATLMLENQADIRVVQEMLGHERITTTEVYTHVSIQHLKEVHSRVHPGANLPEGITAATTGYMMAKARAESKPNESVGEIR